MDFEIFSVLQGWVLVHPWWIPSHNRSNLEKSPSPPIVPPLFTPREELLLSILEWNDLSKRIIKQ
jgi:hypothetical protein